MKSGIMTVTVFLLTLALLLYGCTSYQSPTTVNPPQQAAVPTPAPVQAQPTYVKTVQTSLGEILVDDNGMTLYTFKKDSSGASTCYGQCAATWPPLTVSDSISARSTLPGTLGTTARTDGIKQATYNNQPLYHYIGDGSAGQTSGNGVGSVWYVVVIAPPQAPQPAPTRNMYGY